MSLPISALFNEFHEVIILCDFDPPPYFAWNWQGHELVDVPSQSIQVDDQLVFHGVVGAADMTNCQDDEQFFRPGDGSFKDVRCNVQDPVGGFILQE